MHSFNYVDETSDLNGIKNGRGCFVADKYVTKEKLILEFVWESK